MKLATIRTAAGTTRAARAEAGRYVDLGAGDVGELLRHDGWQERARDATATVEAVGYAPVIPWPGKIICVGLNYRSHILEMGRELPAYPALFAKYPEALVGARDDIVLPPESGSADWEAELAVIVGATVRRASAVTAASAIAGFAIFNDITMRDWQYRSPMWLQGKTWPRTTPFGPFLVTPGELPGGPRPAVPVTCTVDGEMMQKGDTGDLVFDPVALVQYVSAILTLNPGDVIATGTPGGVGHARTPARYLQPGSTVVTEIAGLGRAENTAVPEQLP